MVLRDQVLPNAAEWHAIWNQRETWQHLKVAVPRYVASYPLPTSRQGLYVTSEPRIS